MTRYLGQFLSAIGLAGSILISFEGSSLPTVQNVQVASILEGVDERVKLARRSTDKRSKLCDQVYESLFNNRVFTIYIVFGYKDSRPQRFVADQLEKMALIRHITQKCIGSYPICEFVRNSENTDLFEKAGVKPNGEQVKIKLWLVDSSVGFDDEDNRKNPFQLWKSTMTKKKFQTGLREADIVFYNGHSRGGGGPDFSPPILKLDSSEVNYKLYHHNRTGLQVTQEAVNLEKGSRVKVLGLFSCVSGEHFSGEIKSVNSKVALLTSEVLLYYVDAMRDSVAAMAGILSGYCQREMSGTLQNERGRSGSRLTGLFR